MNGPIEKKTTPPPWVPSNIPKEHFGGFAYTRERPCSSHQELGLGCNHKPKVDIALWEGHQGNGAPYQMYRCLECSRPVSSGVKRIPQFPPRTDVDFKQIEIAYTENLAAAQPDDLTLEEFLQSSEWKIIRDRILAMDNYVCRVCSGVANNVHHRSNENYQKPKDDNLVSLCRRCHEAIHFLNPFERKEKSDSPKWPGHRYLSR